MGLNPPRCDVGLACGDGPSTPPPVYYYANALPYHAVDEFNESSPTSQCFNLNTRAFKFVLQFGVGWILERFEHVLFSGRNMSSGGAVLLRWSCAGRVGAVGGGARARVAAGGGYGGAAGGAEYGACVEHLAGTLDLAQPPSLLPTRPAQPLPS